MATCSCVAGGVTPVIPSLTAGCSGVRVVSVLKPNAKKDPSYFNFPLVEIYKEDAIRRNMRPTFYALLVLSRLSANFDLERIPAIDHSTQIYIGTERMERPSRAVTPQVVFVRAISHRCRRLDANRVERH
jgi:acetyl-CoA carboxylase / biotin carboxylase 1